MSMLIREFPDIFTDSARLVQEQRLGFAGTKHSSEDLHRAFCPLKFHMRHTSTAKKDNSFYKSDNTRDIPAARYFTDEQLQAA